MQSNTPLYLHYLFCDCCPHCLVIIITFQSLYSPTFIRSLQTVDFYGGRLLLFHLSWQGLFALFNTESELALRDTGINCKLINVSNFMNGRLDPLAYCSVGFVENNYVFSSKIIWIDKQLMKAWMQNCWNIAIITNIKKNICSCLNIVKNKNKPTSWNLKQKCFIYV